MHASRKLVVVLPLGPVVLLAPRSVARAAHWLPWSRFDHRRWLGRGAQRTVGGRRVLDCLVLFMVLLFSSGRKLDSIAIIYNRLWYRKAKPCGGWRRRVPNLHRSYANPTMRVCVRPRFEERQQANNKAPPPRRGEGPSAARDALRRVRSPVRSRLAAWVL